jgi:hypothetical protein
MKWAAAQGQQAPAPAGGVLGAARRLHTRMAAFVMDKKTLPIATYAVSLTE